MHGQATIKRTYGDSIKFMVAGNLIVHPSASRFFSARKF